MGVFDGVHRGHQALISGAVSAAKEDDLPAVAVTFDRHPLRTLAPGKEPLPLANLSQNLEWMAPLGLAACLVLPFDEALAHTSAEDFLAFLRTRVRVRELVVGYDFAFGRGREGTVDWLQGRVPAQVLSPVHTDGEAVSSSLIRSHVAEGRMEEAARLLTRPFTLRGTVVGGQRLGRTIGYPTINLAFSGPQLTPGDGVYSGSATTPIGEFRAALSIGMRPTVGGTHRTVEAYLIDYPGDSLYGNTVDLRVERRLRGEEKFDSLDSLVEQMARDVAASRIPGP
jgi:riboflavin kinase/FMN adenylyltransferase